MRNEESREYTLHESTVTVSFFRNAFGEQVAHWSHSSGVWEVFKLCTSGHWQKMSSGSGSSVPIGDVRVAYERYVADMTMKE